MLKTVSSITNAIGALNYQGTWNASTNTPALASSVGTKGDYYVVSVAGSTNLNGTSNWGVGDLATFNGSVWQRVEGGADGNFVNLSVSSTSTLSGLTASTALALNASKEIVSVTNTGTGSNVLATTPTLVGDVTLSTGNLIPSTAAKGVNFTANTPASGTGVSSTSQLLNYYEEGTWIPEYAALGGSAGSVAYTASGTFTRIGRLVTVQGQSILTNKGSYTGGVRFNGLPIPPSANIPCAGNVTLGSVAYIGTNLAAYVNTNSTFYIDVSAISTARTILDASAVTNSSEFYFTFSYIA